MNHHIARAAAALLAAIPFFIVLGTGDIATRDALARPPPPRPPPHTRTNVNRNVNVNQNVNVNRSVHVDVDHDYHRHGGYRPVATAVAVTATAAVVGAMVYSLPPACQTVVTNGLTYHQCGGSWYQPRYSGTQVTYVVVNPPG